jgi:xylose isomerase
VERVIEVRLATDAREIGSGEAQTVRATSDKLLARSDKFSFGLWTRRVDKFGTDPFGCHRPALDPWEYSDKLAELGAWGITFHDNDVFPFDADDATKRPHRRAEGRRRQGRPRHRDGHHQHVQPPGLQGRRLTSNDRSRAPLRAAQDPQAVDLAAELGAETFVMWGGREGSEYDGSKDFHAAFDRYKEGLDTVAGYIKEQGYDLRIGLEPKPNEPRGDIFLPTDRPRARPHRRPRARRHRRPQPRGRPRADGRAELHPRPRAGAVQRQAVPHRPQRPARAKYDQDLVFGHGDLHVSAFFTVDLLVNGFPNQPGRPRYTGPRPLRLQALAHRGMDGIWESARACMETYLHARRQGPRVPGRPARAGRAGLRRGPTSPSRPWPRARASPTSSPPTTASTSDAAAERDFGFVALQQLALEHLIG